MPLPPDLAGLKNKIVVSDSSLKYDDGTKLSAAGEIGIVFDWSSFDETQKNALMGHFGDCDLETDFRDLIGAGGKLRPEWTPFVMWRPDGLDDPEKLVTKQEKKASTQTLAYDKEGEYPQFVAMFFLHQDGRVTSISIDGTFLPAKESELLTKDYKELGLRMATVEDLEREDDEDEDEDEDDEDEDDEDEDDEDEDDEDEDEKGE